MKRYTQFFLSAQTEISMFDRRRKYTFLTILCLTFSSAFLVAGYLLSGWWQILLIFPAAWLFWKISKPQTIVYLPTVLFGSYLFLASFGIWIGLGRFVMLYGCILALASWELQLFQQGLVGKPDHLNIKLLERYHLKSLSIVVVLSFIATTIGLNFQLKIPFGVILLLVLFVGFVLERVYFYLAQKSP